MTKVVTRIAPSPTGDMHIGTARTALFNYLYAKRHFGEFRLRIEDTDRERSTQGAVEVIFNGLDWLGLEYDGESVFQSQNAARHVEVVNQLLDSGHAYCDFMTPEETDAWKAANKGKAFRSEWRDRPALLGEPFVVRFKGPTTGTTVVKDMIKGDVTFQNENLDDLVLLRSDGTPTYNLAVVVDDHDMGVTHVIRGDDHLNNAARQQLIYEALGWDVPAWAHLPLIHSPDGKKLSKRNGDTSLFDYASMGYLPEAMRNYLTRLGWGHGDDEIFSDAQAIEWFDVADVVSAPARLDINKLNSVNQHYMRLADDTRLAALVTEHYGEKVIKPARLIDAVKHLKAGAPTVAKLADMVWFAVTPAFSYDEKAAKVLETWDAKSVIAQFKGALANAKLPYPTEPESVNAFVRAFAEENGLKMGQLGPPLRAALTGTTTAPDIGTLITVLGAFIVKDRLDAAAR